MSPMPSWSYDFLSLDGSASTTPCQESSYDASSSGVASAAMLIEVAVQTHALCIVCCQHRRERPSYFLPASTSRTPPPYCTTSSSHSGVGLASGLHYAAILRS
ncbi:hypothetical protein JMJ77_0005397, partial [Colletotrichum scovillei]